MRYITYLIFTNLLTTIYSLARSLYNDDNLCKVSRLIPTSDVYPYPEYYFPEFYNNSFGTDIVSKKNNYHECENSNILLGKPPRFEDIHLEKWKKQLLHKYKNNPKRCVSNACPLTSDNFHSAWKLIDWNFSADALCQLNNNDNNNGDTAAKVLKNSNKKHHINIIVFGGSMTIGRDSIGTCCVPSSSHCDTTLRHNFLPLDNNLWYCFWYGYLSKWFLHTFPNKQFTFHSLAIGGTSSKVMSTEVEVLLKFRNITLTASDIIFLDHSCNDSGDEKGNGIELLVREIYNNCHNFDPTIIIMEQYVHDDYYKGYRKIAKYYQLPYFSHRKIMNNPTKEQNNLFTLFANAKGFHAPWHMHLLIADELSQWMSDLILYKCNTKPNNKNNNNNNKKIPLYMQESNRQCHLIKKHPTVTINNNNDNNNILRYGQLEPILTNNKYFEHFRCKKENNAILFYNLSSSLFVPTNLSDYENKLNGWTEYRDFFHKESGWMINENAPFSSRNLTFFIPQLLKTPNNPIGLQIKYLKTYYNAGYSKVSICNEFVHEFDSLIGRGGFGQFQR